MSRANFSSVGQLLIELPLLKSFKTSLNKFGQLVEEMSTTTPTTSTTSRTSTTTTTTTTSTTTATLTTFVKKTRTPSVEVLLNNYVYLWGQLSSSGFLPKAAKKFAAEGFHRRSFGYSFMSSLPLKVVEALHALLDYYTLIGRLVHSDQLQNSMNPYIIISTKMTVFIK